MSLNLDDSKSHALVTPERFPGRPESCFRYSMGPFLVDLDLAVVTPERFPGGPESVGLE